MRFIRPWSIGLRRLPIRALLAAALVLTATTREPAHAQTVGPWAGAIHSDLPAPESVSIPWRAGRFTEFHAGSDEEGGRRTRAGTLRGQLYRAPQDGAAAYAVLLAGCGGTYEGANGLWLKLWARNLRQLGIGALALDSFESRGVPNGVCGPGSRRWALRRVDDAHAALNWLVRQPWADGQRIVIMGMSNGGRTALLSISTAESVRFHRFAAAIALYPSCDGMPPHPLLAPALVLTGAADVTEPPRHCADYLARHRHAAIPAWLRSYAEAFHLFDVYPRNDDANAPEILNARADVADFLRDALAMRGGTPP